MEADPPAKPAMKDGIGLFDGLSLACWDVDGAESADVE